eukprot:TRINITY_DN4169_c0_g1_i1.p1 TRINITY_DN4169_c0_g1~~TRINITY_DN4169_c0_g1_i1.p1  ORF type:complete len:463 (+),score=152.49 TRINITY_DN4169_c0_g1_i1:49-1389(+)
MAQRCAALVACLAAVHADSGLAPQMDNFTHDMQVFELHAGRAANIAGNAFIILPGSVPPVDGAPHLPDRQKALNAAITFPINKVVFRSVGQSVGDVQMACDSFTPVLLKYANETAMTGSEEDAKNVAEGLQVGMAENISPVSPDGVRSQQHSVQTQIGLLEEDWAAVLQLSAADADAVSVLEARIASATQLRMGVLTEGIVNLTFYGQIAVSFPNESLANSTFLLSTTGIMVADSTDPHTLQYNMGSAQRALALQELGRLGRGLALVQVLLSEARLYDAVLGRTADLFDSIMSQWEAVLQEYANREAVMMTAVQTGDNITWTELSEALREELPPAVETFKTIAAEAIDRPMFPRPVERYNGFAPPVWPGWPQPTPAPDTTAPSPTATPGTDTDSDHLLLFVVAGAACLLFALVALIAFTRRRTAAQSEQIPLTSDVAAHGVVNADA